jgi:hypothetical protein
MRLSSPKLLTAGYVAGIHDDQSRVRLGYLILGFGASAHFDGRSVAG